MKNLENYEILVSNAEELKKEMIREYQRLSGITLHEASPETLIFSSVAYLMALREEFYNDQAKQKYLRFARDRKSTRLNSSHANISYAVFCLNKKPTTLTEFIYTAVVAVLSSPSSTGSCLYHHLLLRLVALLCCLHPHASRRMPALPSAPYTL